MKKLPIREGEFWIDHFFSTGKNPYFAVYEGLNLVCVCVYRKGAEEVLRRLTKDKTPKEQKEEENGTSHPMKEECKE